MAGIKYYKLMSPKYGDDTTKGCALTGAEVDGNFNFLRGYDIEKIEIVDDKYLKLTRVNGEQLMVDLMSEEVRSLVYDIDNRVNLMAGVVDGLSQDTQQQGRDIENQEQRIESLEQTAGSLTTLTVRHTSEIADHEQRISNVEQTTNALSMSSADYEVRISQLESLVNQLTQQVAALQDKVNDLQDKDQSEFFDQRVRDIVDVLFDDDPQTVSFDRRLVNGKVVSMTPKWGSEVVFRAPIG